jgi:hypothetical protein
MDVLGVTLTEVVPGRLWWGGALGEWWHDAGHAFDIVLACEADVPEPPLRAGQLVLRWAIADTDTLPNMYIARDLATFLAEQMGLEQRTLIHCVQGMNRSAFLTALTLNAWDASWGHSLVARLQALRPGSLYNQTFKAFIEGTPR